MDYIESLKKEEGTWFIACKLIIACLIVCFFFFCFCVTVYVHPGSLPDTGAAGRNIGSDVSEPGRLWRFTEEALVWNISKAADQMNRNKFVKLQHVKEIQITYKLYTNQKD